MLGDCEKSENLLEHAEIPWMDEPKSIQRCSLEVCTHSNVALGGKIFACSLGQ